MVGGATYGTRNVTGGFRHGLRTDRATPSFLAKNAREPETFKKLSSDPGFNGWGLMGLFVDLVRAGIG